MPGQKAQTTPPMSKTIRAISDRPGFDVAGGATDLLVCEWASSPQGVVYRAELRRFVCLRCRLDARGWLDHLGDGRRDHAHEHPG